MMDKFTVENAIYMTDDGPIDIAKMSREQLLRLVINLMNDQHRTMERHAHEREVLSGFRGWRAS